MTEHSSGTRFPASVYGRGDEPDPRFSLANERTFLAWLRTGLALVAAGVALQALELGLQPTLRFAAAVLLVLAGILVPAQSWFSWMRTERSLRRSEPLPVSYSGPLLAATTSCAALLVLLAMILG